MESRNGIRITSDASGGEPADAHVPRCLVVMYHYVRDADPLLPGIRGALTAAQFEEQLDTLCATGEPIDWPHLYAWTQGRGVIPRRCFLLTFDDGLADHYEQVLPRLQRRGLRGTFLVPGIVLNECRLLSAHAIHLLLAVLGDEELEAELHHALDARAPGGSWRRAAPPDGAQTLYHYETPQRARLKYLLTITLPIELRDAVIHELFERHIGSAARWARKWYLNWEQLKELEACGHTVGGHGFAHESYHRLHAADIHRDVVQSEALLREGLGPDLRPFSYPYGSVNTVAREACRRAGFVQAFTTQSRGLAAPVDAWSLPRVDTVHVGTFLPLESACPRT